ncbi:hypothetical protein [Streptomyces sp. NPDC001404]|uniref:hypothetical protein n=1 Tax=Streptomyces sp. NPDC001404 TaxID=3364571 RepID=UPI003679C70E
MTGIWPPAELPGLYVDVGMHTRPWAPERGYWIRPPTADFQCTCGWTASAGGQAVAHFAATIRHTHLKDCRPARAPDDAGDEQ